ncbi:MAG TPA: methylmalonyl-CoA mutase family protein [Bryobacteraceae bacterium]|nr:methylmalonyl-CoA mutase family protein [Bryobacteraceae bacterium]
MADTELATDMLHLRDEFPPVPTADWEAVIQADLKGADYDKKLVWRSEEGVPVRPYYRSEHIQSLRDQTHIPPGAFPYVRGGGSQDWAVVEPGTEPPAGAVRADLFGDTGGTAVQELAFALSAGVDRLADAPDVDHTARSLVFVFAIGSNYFFEIAKLRAARLLWSRAVSAFKPKAESSCRMHVWARTALWNKSLYDPYTNLLRVTTEALSAVIGGCEWLEVRPFRFSDRLAVNVQRIVKEEAHLARVADPAGGSYYVEALTDALAREGWKLFQEVESKGGFAQARGFIDEQIAASRAAKEKAMSSRRKVQVGVNNYPDTEETLPPEDRPAPQEIWRSAEMFERLRMRTEEHARRTGKRANVHLLTRGDLKMRQARAQFCRNLFGCGGFQITESADLKSDADLLVLCSSDAEYQGLAAEVCPLSQQPVIVAGNPKEHIEALNSTGVAGYVHVLSNAVDTIAEWQDKLGMGRLS